MSTQQSTLVKYFDLHTTGYGWLKRVRTVRPTGKKAQPYLACSISAIRHQADGTTKYTNFDLIVAGADAKAVVENLKQHVDASRHVLVGFRIGDIVPESFTYSSGSRAGEVGVSVKGRLLKLFFAKVEGKPMDMLQLSNGAVGNDAIEADFKELKTRGIGYINRIRSVQQLNACNVSAIHGNADDIQYTSFDVISGDSVPSAILEDLKPVVEADRAVLVSFMLHNIYPETFVFQKGDRKGQTGVILKGILQDIVFAKVDGVQIDLSVFHQQTGTQG